MGITNFLMKNYSARDLIQDALDEPQYSFLCDSLERSLLEDREALLAGDSQDDNKKWPLGKPDVKHIELILMMRGIYCHEDGTVTRPFCPYLL